MAVCECGSSLKPAGVGVRAFASDSRYNPRMRYAESLALLVLLAGCDSKPEEKPKDGSKPAAHDNKPAPHNPKAASKDSDIEGDLYMNLPSDLAASMGVEAYPGARVLKSMTGVKGGTPGESYRDIIFFTHDHASKVAEFYKTRLVEAKSVGDLMEKMNVLVDGKNSKGENVRVQAQTMADPTHVHFIIRKPE